LSHTDNQIGRLTKFLEKIGKLENTLIFLCLLQNCLEASLTCSYGNVCKKNIGKDYVLTDSSDRILTLNLAMFHEVTEYECAKCSKKKKDLHEKRCVKYIIIPCT
jgi:hypothetical protein